MANLTNKKLISFGILLAVILFLSYLLSFLKNPTLDILKYPLSGIGLITREIKGFVFFHRNYIENDNLKRQIDVLKGKLVASQEIYLENQRLLKLLSLKQESGYQVVAARVIGRDPTNWSSAILINKGSHSGIKKGSVCLSFLGLVGRVVETSKTVSKILLINDPNLGVSSMVQRSRQEGLVTGSLGGFLTMKYLSSDSDIKAGDIIVTSGLTGNYPKGLLIGTVEDLGDEFSGLSRYALIKPAVNLSGIEDVLIIIE